jgi:hypothetical protein
MSENIQDTEDAIGFSGNQDGPEPDSPLEALARRLADVEERLERLEAERTVQTVKTLP